MRFRPLNRSRAAVFGVAALAAAALLWSAAWVAIARGLENGIEGWVGDRRTEGWTVTHDPFSVDGFPFRWLTRIGRPSLSRAERTTHGFSWSGPWIGLGWAPWTARSVAFRTAGAHFLRLYGGENGEFRIAADEITGRLRIGNGGALERIDIGGDAIVLTPPGAKPDKLPIRVNRAVLHVDPRPKVSAVPGTPPVWLVLDADILGLTMPETVRAALGRTIGRIAGRATVTASLSATRPAEALTAWRDQGGTVEFSRLRVGWGPLAAAGSGTLALDGALQPVGAFRARIAGYGETIDRLSAAGLLTRNQGMVARLALGALARTPAGGGRPEVAVPVSVQDRTLTVGPVPLLRLPLIDWR